MAGINFTDEREYAPKLTFKNNDTIHNVSGSLQEHKQVIKDLMKTYIIDLDENGSPKKSITEIMKLIDRAVKLVSNDR